MPLQVWLRPSFRPAKIWVESSWCSPSPPLSVSIVPTSSISESRVCRWSRVKRQRRYVKRKGLQNRPLQTLRDQQHSLSNFQKLNPEFEILKAQKKARLNVI